MAVSAAHLQVRHVKKEREKEAAQLHFQWGERVTHNQLLPPQQYYWQDKEVERGGKQCGQTKIYLIMWHPYVDMREHVMKKKSLSQERKNLELLDVMSINISKLLGNKVYLCYRWSQNSTDSMIGKNNHGYNYRLILIMRHPCVDMHVTKKRHYHEREWERQETLKPMIWYSSECTRESGYTHYC